MNRRPFFACSAVALGLALFASSSASAQEAAEGDAPDSLEAPPPMEDPSEQGEPTPAPPPPEGESAPEPIEERGDERDDDRDDRRRSRRSRDRDDRYEDDDSDDDRRGRRSRRSRRGDPDADAVPAGEGGTDYLWLWAGTAGGLFLPCGICYSPFIGGAVASMVNGPNWEYGVGSKILASLAMIVATFPIWFVMVLVTAVISGGGSALLVALNLGSLAFIPGIVAFIVYVTMGLAGTAALGALGAGVMELMKDPPRYRDDYVQAPPLDRTPARMVQATPEEADMRF